jgi:hypothetical protein
MGDYLPIASGTATERQLQITKTGVSARWVKDRGFAVTWHTSECLATSAASKPYLWDAKGCGPAEIYQVEVA